MTFRLRMKDPYFNVGNTFFPSSEKLSYSVSLQKLQKSDMKDMLSYRHKVMSRNVCIEGVEIIKLPLHTMFLI